LNFGDCFAYALAKFTGEALLYEGEDFKRTDIISAYDPPHKRTRPGYGEGCKTF
jgi:hypothetical protein